MNYPKEIISGLFTLLSGMWVTFKNLFRPPVTLRYPHEQPKLSPAFRSAISLVRFEKTGTHDCVACMQCVKICPSFCIAIDGEKPEGLKRKRAVRFEVDYALCSVCGLCLDVCPTDTLTYSKRYDEAGYRRDGFVYDLLEDFREGEATYLEQAKASATADAAKKEQRKQSAGKPTSPGG